MYQEKFEYEAVWGWYYRENLLKIVYILIYVNINISSIDFGAFFDGFIMQTYVLITYSQSRRSLGAHS